MADREKVIKGLHCCYENADCNGCPYETECRKISFKTKENHCPILDEILELLKEQEQTIEVLKEKLRLLEYGNNDCVQDALMPAT